jgi:hypothetical protein
MFALVSPAIGLREVKLLIYVKGKVASGLYYIGIPIEVKTKIPQSCNPSKDVKKLVFATLTQKDGSLSETLELRAVRV